ncbi:MAG: hypothetical protein KKD11_03110 [Candidatus Omnitrophica bacterium]|nr:hypothetical protein [Candidatus Omnitrophota bacterium]
MFKNILDFWRGKDFMSQVLEEFESMLDKSKEMFDLVCRRLIYNEEVAGLEEKIYALDKNINELEKDIRKRTAEHLVLRPSVDVSTSLLLMSVVKDAERLGDYCKNLYEVIKLLDRPLDRRIYSNIFDAMDKKISDFFSKTKKVFRESDEQGAMLLWEYERKIVKECDRIIETLTKSSFSVNQAVCFALIARHFKRLTAHLANIGTSVVLPISDLDYFDERRKENDKG